MSDSTPASQDAELQNNAPEVNSADNGAEATPEGQTPSFGWNAYAERTNGRFAMVGFVSLLVMELLTRQDFWTWIGF